MDLWQRKFLIVLNCFSLKESEMNIEKKKLAFDSTRDDKIFNNISSAKANCFPLGSDLRMDLRWQRKLLLALITIQSFAKKKRNVGARVPSLPYTKFLFATEMVAGRGMGEHVNFPYYWWGHGLHATKHWSASFERPSRTFLCPFSQTAKEVGDIGRH